MGPICLQKQKRLRQHSQTCGVPKNPSVSRVQISTPNPGAEVNQTVNLLLGAEGGGGNVSPEYQNKSSAIGTCGSTSSRLDEAMSLKTTSQYYLTGEKEKQDK